MSRNLTNTLSHKKSNHNKSSRSHFKKSSSFDTGRSRDDGEDASNEFQFVSFPKTKTLSHKSSSDPTNLSYDEKHSNNHKSSSSNPSLISYDDDDIIDGYATLKRRAKGKQKTSKNVGYFENDIDENDMTKQRASTPTLGRRKNSFNDAMKNKRRNNSTGHSPDFTQLLQHLICDIEEEVSDDDLKMTSPSKTEHSFKKSTVRKF